MQALPHVPQFWTSVARSTQAAPQAFNWESQLALHAPRLQTSPVGHTLPQLPQSYGLVFRFTQPFWQLVRPGWHSTLHAPAVQLGLEPLIAGQALAQLPQFSGSLATSVHDRPHSWPLGHVSSHFPFSQLALPPAGAPQLARQAPQFSGSEAASTSQPLAMFASQSR
jgi:hypothetical protein